MDYVAGMVSCGNSEADNVLISLVYEARCMEWYMKMDGVGMKIE